ncbi:MAG: hypothetical protein H7A46_22910 [Verrucomicrobiales bacterium]|nr:hypothetical protein [Verrucomicrobiales bacterium]
MKLDYLQDGSDACPLVRLYEFDPADARDLRQTFDALAAGGVERVGLESVTSVDGSQLTFVRSDRDCGIVETAPNRFEVVLAPEGWRQAADFVAPFCDGGFGYQWLTPQTRGIRWLFSKDGAW